MGFKQIIKKNKLILNAYFLIQGYKSFINFKPLVLFKQYAWFIGQYKEFKKLKANGKFSKIEWYPCLLDNISCTPLEPTYFFQDTWAAKQIFRLKPKHHYDIGSSAKTIGILSQFVPTTMVDIRPIELELENLF